MKRLLFVTGAALLILVGAGCTTTEDYYPMSVGSTWNLEGFVLGGTTTTALDTMMTSTIQTKVEREAQLSTGEKVLEFKTTATTHQRVPDTTYTTISTSYVRETGSAILGYESLSDSTADTLLALPLTVGKKWHMADNAIAEAIGQEDVTVKAGSYQKAWKIKVTVNNGGFSIDMFYWYANNVGHVKTHYEFSMSGYSQVFHQELVSCDIK